jgi:uncharacterized protein
LRPTAETAIWSACGTGPTRKRAFADLLDANMLVSVRVGDDPAAFYAAPESLPLLERAVPDHRMIFLGPLDSILWDRKMIQRLFNFEYVWEVYKPEPLRKWGYYVLPVFYAGRFVGRCEVRREGSVGVFSRWWWEADVERSAELATALGVAAGHFMHYLRAEAVRVTDGIDRWTRDALLREPA